MKTITNTTRDTSKKKTHLRAIFVNPLKTFLLKKKKKHLSMFAAFVTIVKLGATVQFSTDPHLEPNMKQNVQDKRKKNEPAEKLGGADIKGTLFR